MNPSRKGLRCRRGLGLATLVAFVLAGVASCEHPVPGTFTPPDGSLDAGADRAMEAESRPPQKGPCLEIFPSPPALADGGLPEDPEDAGLGGPPHRSPMEYQFGIVPVGSFATADIRYYNFCDTEIYGTRYEPAELGDFNVSPLSPGPLSARPFLTGTWQTVFAPKRAGFHELTVRIDTSTGVYETHFVATAR